MIDLGWLKMTAGLLLVAGTVGHLMQNGDVLAERWLGIEIGSRQPLVASREPRLIGYGGLHGAAALPLPEGSVRHMPLPPPLVTGRQPGMAALDRAPRVTTLE